jgi:hypothetical protein
VFACLVRDWTDMAWSTFGMQMCCHTVCRNQPIICIRGKVPYSDVNNNLFLCTPYTVCSTRRSTLCNTSPVIHVAHSRPTPAPCACYRHGTIAIYTLTFNIKLLYFFRSASRVLRLDSFGSMRSLWFWMRSVYVCTYIPLDTS